MKWLSVAHFDTLVKIRSSRSGPIFFCQKVLLALLSLYKKCRGHSLEPTTYVLRRNKKNLLLSSAMIFMVKDLSLHIKICQGFWGRTLM